MNSASGERPGQSVHPHLGRGLATGAGVAVVAAIAYAVLAELFQISWGLIVVGIVAGLAVGGGVLRGAFEGPERTPSQALRWAAVGLTGVAWLGGTLAAYLLSQVFYQAATTPLAERLSMAGLIEYATGDVAPRALTLAASIAAAWRAAR